ncbi:MAG: ribosomal-processing cysteine protease Prp [Ruminococcus sp.]|nr:ribosomal-processing cysteine protease Prp [Ruminococcus sp.]
MIRAEFYDSKGLLNGFSISGHAGYAEKGSDVVCASVSSAVQLIVNLLNEFDCEPKMNIGENIVECKTTSCPNTASAMLEQLKLHFEAILEEFPKTIKITISEV